MIMTSWYKGLALAFGADFSGSSPTAPFFFTFLSSFIIYGVDLGDRGFESCSKMAFLRRSAALMRPPFSFPAHKVV